MKTIIWGQWLQFKRSIGLFILMVVFTILFSYIMGSSHSQTATQLEISYTSDGSKEVEEIIEWLEQNGEIRLKPIEAETMETSIQNGTLKFGLHLKKDQFKILRLHDDPTIYSLIAELERTYAQATILNTLFDESVKEEVKLSLTKPLVTLQMEGNDSSIIQNEQLRSIFGFTLFFVIYTISTSLANMVKIRETGIWNRLIISPMTKTQFYMGYLLFASILGISQISLIFCLFHYVFGVKLGEHVLPAIIFTLPYVVTIVAVCLIVVSFVKTAAQYYAIIPFISVSLAMLGGAFWPLDIVQSDILLTLSNVSPIKHGITGLTKLATPGVPLAEFIYPFSLLLFIAVVLIGVGINIIERKTHLS